ncbi:MAG: sigma factor-like helix-turn-helix DNA-binding protein [Desulfuromonadales bacterium]
MSCLGSRIERTPCLRSAAIVFSSISYGNWTVREKPPYLHSEIRHPSPPFCSRTIFFSPCIADHFQISRERVRQIEERALIKLKIVLAPQVAAVNF